MESKENSHRTAIKEQFNRIVSTPAFASSRILSGFLEYIIEKKLSEKEDEIKEYTIGVNVLARSADFNPQLDAIVRIHAGRLRRALKEYYYETGKDDAIRIEVPKGGYVPIFQSQNGIEHTSTNTSTKTSEKRKPAGNKPIVAVLPFRNISKDASRDFFADGLGEQLSTELTWFRDLTVISYYSSRHVAGKTNDITEAANLLGAKYILTGSIQNDNKHLLVRAQLILGDGGEQLWAKSFEQKNTASGLFEIQNAIARNILTAVGGYHGAILRDMLKAPFSSKEDGIEIYDAVFWFYRYQIVFTKEAFQKTVSLLEAAVKVDPNYALAWAMLGEIYLDDKVLEFKETDNPAEQGLKYALHAANLDPNCQHAYRALAWVYLFHHNREECLKAVDKCIALNPNAADMVGAMGFVLTCAGEFDRGFKMLNDSIEFNPFFPWWFKVGFVLYALYKKEYQQANDWAEKIDMPELLWDPLLKAVSLGHLNRIEKAALNLELIEQIVPDASNQVKNIIESFILSQDLNNEILEGVRKAGLYKERQITTIEAGK